MFWKRVIVVAILSFLALYPLIGQRFPCNGRMILATNQERTPNRFYSVEFQPFGLIVFSGGAVHLNGIYDAIGFNPRDHYIYGVNKNNSTNSIVRIFANGTFETLGEVPTVANLNAFAGDCTPEGLYLCHDNDLNQILVFEVVDNFALIDRIDLFWDPNSENSGPFTTRIDDFVIDPTNPTVAYTFQGDYFDADLAPNATRGYLLKINLNFSDPQVGMVTPIASIESNIIRKIGSLFFTGGGGLHGYGSLERGPRIDEDRLISINKNSGDANFVKAGPIARVSDGCSCPYSLSFQNSATPRQARCNGGEITFTLSIDNRTVEGYSGLTITDTIPEGMVIESISGNFIGDIAPGTGIGTGILTINNLEVPLNTRVEINIQARVVDIPLGLISNQAYLQNLPERYGDILKSDDPQTLGFIGDATNFFGDPPGVDEVEVSITHPSNCLNPNDAQILISSPSLFAGNKYIINYNNTDWELITREVIVDDNNSILLDSLTPGKYRKFLATPENSVCSFQLIDSTVNIYPPNEQLKASVESNSPICEGTTLQLSASISPDGTVRWTGPERFSTTDLTTQIRQIVPEQSGTYEMTATYGACEQIRLVEVEVEPAIQASISAQQQYCERDTLELVAEGQGELETFQWTGPDDMIASQQTVNIPSLSLQNEGLYQVVIDNGSCQDTANTIISVAPSPNISLPVLFETDFCEPLTFRPEITGGNTFAFHWAPADGLSCSNCPYPQTVLPYQDRFQLIVENEWNCRDSAVVNITLDKEKLLFAPNAFSPNQDGVNDYFQLFPSCVTTEIENLEIYARWGAKVFAKGPLAHHIPWEFWDGTLNGEPAPKGTYIWYADIELIDGTQRRLTGEVKLMR